MGDLLARLEAAYAAESSDEVAPTEVDPLPEAPAEAQIERETVTIDDGTDAADNAPSLVAENDAEPPSEDGPANQIHVSEVENVSVQNGDVTIGGQTRVQNLTVVQYLDLVGRTLEAGRPYPTPAIRGTASPPTQKGPPWPGALTNPDNPWGFDFPPTPLVK